MNFSSIAEHVGWAFNCKYSRMHTKLPVSTSRLKLRIAQPKQRRITTQSTPHDNPSPSILSIKTSHSSTKTIQPPLKLPINPKFTQNQHIPVSPETSARLNAIFRSFKPPIRYALAYGSGVFLQKNYLPSHTPMLDFIFAVSHPSHWHSINLQHNPHHYSIPARLSGSAAVSWLQERGPGAGIWYNLQARVNDNVIKYGVISVDALCDDLIDWQTLYVSGRMHKPTHIIQDDARVRLAQQVNLASSLRTALLLLPDRFPEMELYRTIAGLSYAGDFRMRFGENPKKIDNIVDHQIHFFRVLYSPLLNALKSNVTPLSLPNHESNNLFVQDYSPKSRAELFNKLPIKLKQKILANCQHRYILPSPGNPPLNRNTSPRSSSDDLDTLTKIVSDDSFSNCLRKSLVEIIYYPSLYQSLKGIFSAGPLKSLKYASAKVMKRFSS